MNRLFTLLKFGQQGFLSLPEDIINVVGLLESLNAVTPPDSFMLKCSGGGTVRVMPNSIDAYSTNQGGLFTDKRIPFHSYQLKQSRGFRVVIRLHPTSQKTNFLTDELAGLGHEVRDVQTIVSSISRKELNLCHLQ
ncbi:GH23733 [Drosophila grimshawi]|uniref:GH23733 n=1 Tax=Drosophila grimshawi TaxID=7222 RepID=B4K0U3_DROGR|nr:GH23733 [Drosophila grimshawi]